MYLISYKYRIVCIYLQQASFHGLFETALKITSTKI